MPELPEVETIIRYLSTKILNQKIEKVIVNNEKLIKNASGKEFASFLINESFEKILRRGKYLVFLLSNNKMFISHLRMEGKYKISENKTKIIEKHSHIVFYTNKLVIEYNDFRAFGTFEIYRNQDFEKYIKIGPEPFSKEFSFSYLEQILKKSNKNIKTFLLDQKTIAGLGNIYANEVLFWAKISPLKKAKDLKENEIKKLYNGIKIILEKAINEGGSTISTYHSGEKSGNYQNYLLVHTVKNCKNCNEKIEKISLNGRGTYFCKKCQI